MPQAYRCPLTSDWVTADPRPVEVVVAEIAKEAAKADEVRDNKVAREVLEREASVARRVCIAPPDFALAMCPPLRPQRRR